MKISKSEFAARRKRLMSEMAPNSVAIIPAAREVTRSRDTEYPFRQNSDFFYLTGFQEPDGVLLLLPGRRQGQVLMFCRDRDPERELWDGYRQGPEGVVKNFGMNDAYPVGDMDDIVPGLIEGRSTVYYSMGHDDSFDRQVFGWINQIRAKVRTGAKPPGDISDLAVLLHEHRLIKSEAEVRIMQRAADISAEAHCRAMRECRPGRYEYHLESSIQHGFAEHGARFPAYNSIVGSGKNACCLHYTENDAKMQDGDLVLSTLAVNSRAMRQTLHGHFPSMGVLV